MEQDYFPSGLFLSWKINKLFVYIFPEQNEKNRSFSSHSNQFIRDKMRNLEPLRYFKTSH